MTREDNALGMLRATNAIQRESPGRTVIMDGLSVGNEVVDEMVWAGVGQPVHADSPSVVSH